MHVIISARSNSAVDCWDIVVGDRNVLGMKAQAKQGQGNVI
jgi:hypothetical protein